MCDVQLHKAQLSILRGLRHAPAARYSELRRPTGMDSDVFKFHLRKLVHQHIVAKREDGLYVLTPAGKEYANNLDKRKRAVQKQPKLSVVIVAARQHGGRTEYLCQQRRRHPYYGFWGCISGPVQWGEPFEMAAKRELEKQTGLSATFAVKGFCRQSDYAEDTEILLEDKLFVIVEAVTDRFELRNDWEKGENAWMTIEELAGQDRYFPLSEQFIRIAGSDMSYRSHSTAYRIDEY
jgi:ADP-ribose pyrophosphatase YjhB (NUDIX family)